MNDLTPADEAGVAEAVKAAATDAVSLELVGGGSLEGFGRPVQAGRTLRLRQLRGIPLYRPSELVIRALAGTPVGEVVDALDAEGQALPFEPPDLRHLLGNDDAEPTIGGLVAANLSGPARISRGALRDSLIGVRFVDGQGRIQRSGGRVMKNVTGLDLVKLQAGAHGTLGALTEVTFKVLPRSETQSTLLVGGLDAAAASRVMARAMASPLDVSAAAYLPPDVAARSVVAELAGRDDGVVALRLDTFASFLPERLRKLRQHVAAAGATDVLEDQASGTLWGEIRDVRLLTHPLDRAVWRISTAASNGPRLLVSLATDMDGRGFADWSGGLLWLAVAATDDAGAGAIRAAVDAVGGHATLVRAPLAIRAAVDVFHPEAPRLAALTRSVKAAVDPQGIVNPGRMYAGL
ncbi:MAG: FAD-binding protein [Pseudomonadota bacterium]